MKVVNEKQNDWDEHLKPVAFSYRTGLQNSRRFSPFEMMYGAKSRLPLELDVSTAEVLQNNHDFEWCKTDDDELTERFENISGKIEQVRREGIENLRKTLKQAKTTIRSKTKRYILQSC